MRKTFLNALVGGGIAAALLVAAPAALAAKKKTPTPAAETSEKKADKPAKTEKVNLNTADEKDIAAAKGVGAKLAAELVKNRPYKTWDDVSKVKGVGTGKKLESLKKVLKLSEGVAAAKEDTAAETKTKGKKGKSSSKGEEESAVAGGTSGGATGGSAASSESSSSSKKSSSSSSSSSSEKTAASRLAPGEKININTASAEELDRLPEIGPVKAQAIVDYRNANGKFASIEDVMKVSGIKEGTFAKIKDHITVR